MSANSRSIQSLDRSFDILEALARASTRGMGLKELCTATRLNASTAHHLVATMVHRGYVAQDSDSRRYKLGPTLLRLRTVVADQLDLRQVGAPLANELLVRTQESVYLTVLREWHNVTLLELPSPHPVRVVRPSGPNLDLHATASGKCALAFKDEKTIDEYLDKFPLTAFTPNTMIDPAQIRRELQTIRATGIIYDREEHVLGVACIAAPIFNHLDEYSASLSISYPTFRATPVLVDQWSTVVVECAQRFSILLGHVAPIHVGV